MPRGRTGFSSSRSDSRSNSTGQKSNYSTTNHSQQQQQKPVQATPQPTMPMQSGGMMGGIGSTIMTGMAFGGGSEIGHQVVKSFMGGSSHNEKPKEPQQNQIQQQPVENTNSNNNQQQKSNICSGYSLKFNDCLKFYDNNISSCQSYFDDLKSCEKSLI